ncbi:MAG: hypothetical protein LBV66_00400 [Elusimicrobiota bacterium]|jgi:hypothetical protein|nr:hypothetical protein [Elusimicrobiota bacterium]
MKEELKRKHHEILTGSSMQDNESPWVPTYKWFGKVMGAILLFLVVVFILGNIILKPYMIESPMEITPWLDSSKPKTSILGI